MKQKLLFILIGAIALIGLSSCDSIYNIGKEETDKSLGYQILSDKLVSAWFFDYETGKDVVVDSLEKSDWALYLSGIQVSFSPISLEAKRYMYEEDLRIPVGSEQNLAIDVEIGGLEFTYTYGGKSYVLEPLQALYIDVGELKPYVDPDVKEGDGVLERYTSQFKLVTQAPFTGKEIVLAQKTAHFEVRVLEKYLDQE